MIGYGARNLTALNEHHTLHSITDSSAAVTNAVGLAKASPDIVASSKTVTGPFESDFPQTSSLLSRTLLLFSLRPNLPAFANTSNESKAVPYVCERVSFRHYLRSFHCPWSSCNCGDKGIWARMPSSKNLDNAPNKQLLITSP